jgi:hypothetical protein
MMMLVIRLTPAEAAATLEFAAGRARQSRWPGPGGRRVRGRGPRSDGGRRPTPGPPQYDLAPTELRLKRHGTTCRFQIQSLKRHGTTFHLFIKGLKCFEVSQISAFQIVLGPGPDGPGGPAGPADAAGRGRGGRWQ